MARVLAEQVDRILPGLLRVFDGSEKVVSYSPTRPGDEAAGIPPQEPGLELAGSRAYQEMIGGQPGMPAQEVTLYEIEIRR
ncbi:hypothetical protein, partial [Methylobacterium sp. WL7]|uniref:hypothetical protein n=1 Tax=Methylobacterium sp. WL7 TaxID=2603900 RepID=UPI001AEE38E1